MAVRFIVGSNAEFIAAVQADQAANGITSDVTVVTAAGDLAPATADDDIIYADGDVSAAIQSAIDSAAATKHLSNTGFVCRETETPAVPQDQKPLPRGENHKILTLIALEGFEGEGAPSGWTSSIHRGTIDWDHADPNNIVGTYSLELTTMSSSTGDYAEKVFAEVPAASKAITLRCRLAVGAGYSIRENLSMIGFFAGSTELGRFDTTQTRAPRSGRSRAPRAAPPLRRARRPSRPAATTSR